MRNNILVALLLIGVFIISIACGYIILSTKNNFEKNYVGEVILAGDNNKNQTITTSKQENVVSPNNESDIDDSSVDNNQSYVVKEYDGCVAIYRIEESGEIVLEEVTDILTKYLSEEDLIALREGISAIGLKQLTHIIEDFE